MFVGETDRQIFTVSLNCHYSVRVLSDVCQVRKVEAVDPVLRCLLDRMERRTRINALQRKALMLRLHPLSETAAAWVSLFNLWSFGPSYMVGDSPKPLITSQPRSNAKAKSASDDLP